MMQRSLSHRLWTIAILAVSLAIAGSVSADGPADSSSAPKPLKIVVMDPMAAELACKCVKGYAQRDYHSLARHFEAKLHRPVTIEFAERLDKGINELGGTFDLVIGKHSVVESDAAEAKQTVVPIAMLTDLFGSVTQTGIFVVRSGDPAKTVADLARYRIIFGPANCEEKQGAPLATLKKVGVAPLEKIETSPSCSEAATLLLELDPSVRAAAAISSYAQPLLEGCGTIKKGDLRVVGATDPIPFVAAFINAKVPADERSSIEAALWSMAEDLELLLKMESRDGFVAPIGLKAPAKTASPGQSSAWPQWRGPSRDGIVGRLPSTLSSERTVRWRATLTHAGLAGVSASSEHVFVADRDANDVSDVFRCFSAADGKQIWEIAFAAPGALDWGNSPRATPLVHEGSVYFLGAFGQLHCIDIATGRQNWERDLMLEFMAEPLTWGFSSSPIYDDGKVIVNPGAPTASLVALDAKTGDVVWETPGGPAAYSSFIVGVFGAKRQLVGYDRDSLGGWNVATGERLWKLVPPRTDDFNVPTPIALDGKLLVATENNGARLYGFDEQGAIIPEPLAVNDELAPDSSTPVVVGHRVFGCWGDLFCLDLNDRLKPVWQAEDPAFDGYVSLIADAERVMVVSRQGEIVLIDALADDCKILARVFAFDKPDEIFSHPAIVDHNLYIRDHATLYCITL